MLSKLLKLNNTTMTQKELLSLRHLSDYVGMQRIREYPKFNLYLIVLVNYNFMVVKVEKGE